MAIVTEFVINNLRTSTNNINRNNISKQNSQPTVKAMRFYRKYQPVNEAWKNNCSVL